MYFPDNDPDRREETVWQAETQQEQQPRRKKTRAGLKITALCLCCALLGGAAGLGGAAWLVSQGKLGGSETTVYQGESPAVVVQVANLPSEKVLTPAEVYKTNVGSCVGITVSTTTNVFGYTTTSAATGSGFVLTADGYIITNYHVIEEAAKDASVPISVAFQNGDSYDAKLVGAEKDNDVAVLKIQTDGLTPVVLGDSDSLVIGQAVYAIGNPLGELTYTLTDGLVSALDRVITTGSGNDAASLNMLQTNCAINSGNSGGPLFNAYGEVVGITTAKVSGGNASATVEGLGFAIPINDVKDIIQDLIEHGYVTGKPHMGVTVSSVTEADAKRYGLPVGAYVETVEEGSCAQKAGLQVGDIITSMDDTVITTHSALVAAKATYRAGDTVTLKIVRDHEEMELKITFDEELPSQQTQPQQPQSDPAQNGQGGNGGSYGNGYGNGGSYLPWPFDSMFPF